MTYEELIAKVALIIQDGSFTDSLRRLDYSPTAATLYD